MSPFSLCTYIYRALFPLRTRPSLREFLPNNTRQAQNLSALSSLAGELGHRAGTGETTPSSFSCSSVHLSIVYRATDYGGTLRDVHVWWTLLQLNTGKRYMRKRERKTWVVPFRAQLTHVPGGRLSFFLSFFLFPVCSYACDLLCLIACLFVCVCDIHLEQG